MLNTVNVIEMNEDNGVMQLKSFPETPKGNKAAETLFVSVCRDNVTDVSDESISIYTDNGYCTFPAGGCAILVHSC